VKQEGERRNIFLRYLGEVATAVSTINEKTNRDELYEQLVEVARKKTHQADLELDARGKPIKADVEDFGEHVLIVEQPAAAVETAPQRE
jgi:DNA topoisomerase-6 subunit B